MANLKRSKQRESIKAFLATRTDHPTADTIYMNIRQEFPNWKFVSANVSNTVDNTSILKAERVILFTDTLGHSNYYKFMQTIQAHNIPFSFLHGVNIDRNIIQIYEDVFASK